MVDLEEMSAPEGTILVYAGGRCKPNPGRGSRAVILYGHNGEELDRHAERIVNPAECTNNLALYLAVLKALEMAKERDASALSVSINSILLVKQLRGMWAIRNPALREVREERIDPLEAEFEAVGYSFVSGSDYTIRELYTLLKALDE